mgnify:CR=1 FL=1
MDYANPRALVSTEWLAENLLAPGVHVIDATFFLPTQGRDAKAEYAAAHIPGAVFFDIDDIADSSTDLPHMLPSADKFSAKVGALGIANGDYVVAYDANGGALAAVRAWWMFRVFGHDKVAVLNGGLPKWRAEGRPLTAEATPLRDRHLTVTPRRDMAVDATEVARAVKLGTHAIVDARATARFEGGAPEPRAGLRSGHVPGSRNLFFRDLLRPDGTMRDEAGIRAAFAGAGVDLDRPVITTCGSGVTAAVLSLALERIGKTDHQLYDGSWSEWGMFPDLPVETGPAKDNLEG